MLAAPRKVETQIPARLDRLPWSSWHWLVVIALGVTWLLDGLEVTLAGSMAGVLKGPHGLNLTDAQLGISATAYLSGAVIGALIFGYLTDRLGRKKLFVGTLLLYLTATALTAFSTSFEMFLVFRLLTGAGIGGEYAAINSAIDELIPARVRGHVDLAINATFWLGAAIGAGAAIILLDSDLFPPALGWRLAFGLGAAVGLVILVVRHWIPESPRWLMTHGRTEEAEKIVAEIERSITDRPETLPPPETTTTIYVQERVPWRDIWHVMMVENRSRSFLSFALMVSQAFFYNGVMFTYGLLLMRYYEVSASDLGWYLLPLSAGNFFGPILLGRLFDRVGRVPMISGTYIATGVLLAITAWMFNAGMLTATQQAICWSIIFFVASSAASSAYLTASEIFPLEIRALAIAIFFAFGTLIGGVGAPMLFGELLETNSRDMLCWGYYFASLLMIAGGSTEWFLGVRAERKPLEEIAAPLASYRQKGSPLRGAAIGAN